MKQNHFLATMKTCLLAVASSALLFTSCAQDGFDDGESFTGTIESGDVLSAPDVATFNVKSSTDRTMQTISWKAVSGALDYLVTIYTNDAPFTDDVTGTLVVQDSLVHNPYVGIPRLKATYYRIMVRSAENKAEKNPASEESAQFDWDTYLIEVAVVAKEGEESVDFAKFMEENPIAQIVADFGVVCPVVYYFNSNIPYTMSNTVDFGGYEVTLASESEDNKPIITLGEKAVFSTYSSFTLENLRINCADINTTLVKALITLSDTPDEALKGATGSGDYYNIQSAITLNGCEISNMPFRIIFDNDVKYCLETFEINNSTLQFDITSNLAAHGYIDMQKGFIKDLILTNSSFWNVGENDIQYFIKYQNAGRLDRAGYDKTTETESVSHESCTFYNIANSSNGQWANYPGIVGQAYTTFSIKNNIFVNCSSSGGGIARRLLGGRTADNYTTKCEFYKNTYWSNGKAEAEGAPGTEGTSSYDRSGTALQTDPQLFAPDSDPANLMPQGAEQVENKTGDPRWWPVEE